MSKDNLHVGFEALVGVTAAFLVSLPSTVLALIILQAMDVVTGLMSGYINKELSSKTSYAGLMRKALVLVAVGGSSYLGQALQLPSPEVLPTTIAGFYAMHEALSILENLIRAGVPLPDPLKNALAKEHHDAESDR